MAFTAEDYKGLIEESKALFQPAIEFNKLAVEAWERVARHSYAVSGDYLEFAVQQLRLPAEVKGVGEYANKQSAAMQSFGEKMSQRTREFLELAKETQGKVVDLAENETKPARKASQKKAA